MKLMSIVFLGCLWALGASANALKCESADHRFKYSFSQPDGGPSMASTILLEVDETTVIAEAPLGGAKIHTATLDWEGNAQTVKPPKTTKSFRTTYYVQKAKVTAADGRLLYAGKVSCVAETYIGIPRP